MLPPSAVTSIFLINDYCVAEYSDLKNKYNPPIPDLEGFFFSRDCKKLLN